MPFAFGSLSSRMDDGLRTFLFPCAQNLPRVPFAHDEIGKLAVQGPQNGIKRG